MSLYKRPGAETYSYDFELGGRRFSGNTECASKREAAVVERTARDEARQEIKQRAAASGAPLTFKQAASRYWLEVGQHHRGEGADNTLWSLEWLEREIGAGRLVREIDDKIVARIVARRRGETARGTKRLVSNATVNRSVVEPLRKILSRASKVWKEPGVPGVAWREHMLKEPKERVRELRLDEETRLFAELRADYHPVVRFAILTGCRLSECISLCWADVDWGGRLIWINGKGGKLASIPMPPVVRDLLWAERGNHEDVVFTYVAERRREGRLKGQRYPITREGLKTAFRRVLPDASIENYRFHDNRHTAATRTLRATGNLRVTQTLLRHESVSTTTKYAHVTHEDVLTAMQKAADAAAATAGPTESPTGNDGEAAKYRSGKGK